MDFDRLRVLFHGLSLFDKKLFLKEFIDRIVVYPERFEIFYRLPTGLDMDRLAHELWESDRTLSIDGVRLHGGPGSPSGASSPADGCSQPQPGSRGRNAGASVPTRGPGGGIRGNRLSEPFSDLDAVNGNVV